MFPESKGEDSKIIRSRQKKKGEDFITPQPSKVQDHLP
jgi:hypothetical protein